MARIILFLALLLCPSFALAQASFENWRADFLNEAQTRGISSAVLSDAAASMVFDPRVIELDQRQPEGRVRFQSYAKAVMTSQRIQKGSRWLAANKVALREISTKYGVPPEMIMALWSIESGYGANTGNFDLIGSLATLAFEGRRATFFRNELFSALRLMEVTRAPARALRGSWAGAMGQCQFMPSTYLKFAVDYNGDGIANIWDSHLDIWASIANYLAAEGWKGEGTWGREVKLSQPIEAAHLGYQVIKPLGEWAKLGVKTVGGKPLPAKKILASLLQPDGPGGRSFLVYDNFHALMKWNKSTYFGLTVGLLSDQIKQPPVVAKTKKNSHAKRKKR